MFGRGGEKEEKEVCRNLHGWPAVARELGSDARASVSVWGRTDMCCYGGGLCQWCITAAVLYCDLHVLCTGCMNREGKCRVCQLHVQPLGHSAVKRDCC